MLGRVIFSLAQQPTRVRLYATRVFTHTSRYTVLMVHTYLTPPGHLQRSGGRETLSTHRNSPWLHTVFTHKDMHAPFYGRTGSHYSTHDTHAHTASLLVESSSVSTPSPHPNHHLFHTLAAESRIYMKNTSRVVLQIIAFKNMSVITDEQTRFRNLNAARTLSWTIDLLFTRNGRIWRQW